MLNSLPIRSMQKALTAYAQKQILNTSIAYLASLTILSSE